MLLKFYFSFFVLLLFTTCISSTGENVIPIKEWKQTTIPLNLERLQGLINLIKRDFDGRFKDYFQHKIEYSNYYLVEIESGHMAQRLTYGFRIDTMYANPNFDEIDIATWAEHGIKSPYPLQRRKFAALVYSSNYNYTDYYQNMLRLNNWHLDSSRKILDRIKYNIIYFSNDSSRIELINYIEKDKFELIYKDR